MGGKYHWIKEYSLAVHFIGKCSFAMTLDVKTVASHKSLAA